MTGMLVAMAEQLFTVHTVHWSDVDGRNASANYKLHDDV